MAMFEESNTNFVIRAFDNGRGRFNCALSFDFELLADGNRKAVIFLVRQILGNFGIAGMPTEANRDISIGKVLRDEWNGCFG